MQCIEDMNAILLILAAIICQPILAADNKPKPVPNGPKAKAAIQAAIRKAAGKPTGKLTKADLEKVTVISINNYPHLISDISAFTELTQLTNLHLYHNQLTDVSALSKLTQLKVLSLDYCQLTDISALAKLTQLKQLNLHHNKLTDISALAELKQLEILRLSANQLTDVSALSKLTRLKYLELQVNPGITKAKISKLQKMLPKCNINLMGGRAAKQNSDPKSGIANSWTGYEIAEDFRYTFKLQRTDGEDSDLFIGSFLVPDNPSYLTISKFRLVSVQKFHQSDLIIVTFERETGHIYRAILTKDGTKMIYGTRGSMLGNTEENPQFRRTKWALELEKTKN